MSLLGKLDLDVRTSRKFRPCQHGARASAQLAGAMSALRALLTFLVVADALQAGAIAGAGIDTYGLEPVPKTNRFLDLPNTVLTPHLGYVTHDTYEIFYGQTVENIVGWLKGEPVRVIG